MGKLNAILCSAAVCCIWIFGFAKSQASIRCLFSRLDVEPCIPNIMTTLPGPNHQGIYRTRIGRGPSGGPQCTYINPVRFPNAEIVEPINNLGNMNLRLLFSPGFLLEEDYANAMLVTYNVQCPAGRLAFYNLNELDLQDADCFERCTDYLEVQRPGFGTTESCGKEPQDNLFQLEEGAFTVTFRTGERTRGTGFELYIICFDPLELDFPGCDRVGENGTNSTNTTRRKRDLDEFHNQWRRRLRRGAAGTRFQELNIAHNDTVTFRDSLLTVNSGEMSARFRNIFVLHTFDSEGNLDQFIREATVMNQTTGDMNFIEFVGPGPMIIIGRHAYFQLFAIDPRGIIPNPAEEALFEELTTELFDTLSAENDNNITNPTPPPEPLPEFDDLPFPGRRRKRQVQPGAGNFISDQAIRDAILNENNCNPALRTVAEITLQIANEQNATRVAIIRAMIEGPSTEPPVLDLVCSLEESVIDINVNCSVDNMPVSSGSCSIDSETPFDCMLPLNVNTTTLSAGNHTFTVTVTQNGLTGQDTLSFEVNRLSCSTILPEVTCTLNNNIPDDAQCSFNGGDFVQCTFPLEVNFVTLIVRVTAPNGQVLEASLDLSEE